MLLPQQAEVAVPCDKVPIFVSPRVACAVERIAVALHAGFVAVVDARHARQHKLQKRGKAHALKAGFALLRGERVRTLPLAAAAARRFSAEHRQSALRIVRADVVHQNA